MVHYSGKLLAAAPGYALVRAVWQGPRTDLGYVVFEPGDVFDEHFYADRYYAVFVLRGAAGTLKGWYCNVSRPAQIGPDAIDSEDLELDLFVPPDRQHPLRLDEDEFAARALDAATRAAAWAALAELEQLAGAGVGPFDLAS